METEPELEPQPETDVMATPTGEPQRGVDPPPRTSSVFFEPFPDILNGDVRRSTLQGIVDVLKVEPQELTHELEHIAAYPIAPTNNELLHASINVINRGATQWNNKQEMDIIELEHMHMRDKA